MKEFDDNSGGVYTTGEVNSSSRSEISSLYL